MRKSILPLLFAMISCSLVAQYETVEFNYEKSSFNNGRPLPAETYFQLQGQVSPSVTMVEVQVYTENGYPMRDPLYTKTWKRSFDNRTQRFMLPINYNLRGGEEYDVALLYFKDATPVEVDNFKAELYATLDAYVDQNLDFERKKIELLKDNGSMVQDMNEIVRSAMSYYRTHIERRFEGFSDLVKDGIERVEDSRQNKILGRNSSEKENLEKKKELVNDLKIRIHSEVSYLLNSGLLVLGDLKHVDNYRTEKTQNIFTLHGGYGGAYFSESNKQDLFGRGFMAGVTLPLAKKQFASPFWSRTSLMFGVYFNNFELDNNIEATGPLLKRPYYVGVGYKFYRFLRISAGATLLENDGNINGQAVSSDVYVRPYISLTADINLWIGLAK